MPRYANTEYSCFSRLSTARGSSTSLVMVGPTKVKAFFKSVISCERLLLGTFNEQGQWRLEKENSSEVWRQTWIS